jgi:GTP-binding protein
MNSCTDDIFSVAIVGRANVGKTTIFNRLVGTKRSSIVANVAGVTRDRNEVEADFFGLKIRFIDCAGMELRGKKDVISRQMLEQAMEALRIADFCLFVIDGTFGVIEQDVEVFNILRKQEKKSVLIINKAENPNKIIEDNLTSINCQSKIFLSAEHNLGFGDLFSAIKKEYDFWFATNGCKIAEKNKEDQHEAGHKIRIAILGRPNAGKSTFLNNVLQQKRLITSDISGTTRDKIELNFQYTNPNTKNKQDFVLIDTAGIRKKHKNGDNLELASVDKSLEALQFADVVVMIMDITTALEEQDLTLCQRICNE